MRRAALLLGTTAALLAACGGGKEATIEVIAPTTVAATTTTVAPTPVPEPTTTTTTQAPAPTEPPPPTTVYHCPIGELHGAMECRDDGAGPEFKPVMIGATINDAAFHLSHADHTEESPFLWLGNVGLKANIAKTYPRSSDPGWCWPVWVAFIGDGTLPYNELDWKLETPTGELKPPLVFPPITNVMGYGEIASGGQAIGWVCFETPTKHNARYALVYDPAGTRKAYFYFETT